MSSTSMIMIMITLWPTGDEKKPPPTPPSFFVVDRTVQIAALCVSVGGAVPPRQRARADTLD